MINRNDEYDSGYGERLRKIRAVLEISQKMFAKNIGIAPSVLSELEREVTKPGYNFLMKLAETFDISPTWVITGKGEMFLSQCFTPQLNPYDFGDQDNEIRDLLIYCQKSPLLRLSVISFFQRYLLENEDLINRDIQRQVTENM